MFSQKTFTLLAVLLSAGIFTSATAEQLTSHGWTGSDDSEGTKFIGCQLESPPSLAEPHASIRVAAINPLNVFIQFASRFDPAQPEQQVVRLALGDGEALAAGDWTSDHGYIVRSLSQQTTPDGTPYRIIQLRVSADDDILPRLGAARFLKVYHDKVENMPAFGLVAIDLKHAASQGRDANDTAEAIAAVMACVNRHPFTVELSTDTPMSLPVDAATQAAWQAKSDFGLSVDVTLGETVPTRVAFRQSMIDAGSFYCDAKKFITYDSISGETYEAKVASAAQAASGKLSRLAFWPAGRTAEDILLVDLGMNLADKYLCPGWPGHPRPRP